MKLSPTIQDPTSQDEGFGRRRGTQARIHGAQILITHGRLTILVMNFICGKMNKCSAMATLAGFAMAGYLPKQMNYVLQDHGISKTISLSLLEMEVLLNLYARSSNLTWMTA